jgi:hypothetical protein
MKNTNLENVTLPDESNDHFEVVDERSSDVEWKNHAISATLESFLSSMEDFRDAVDISISSVKKRKIDDLAKCSKELQKVVSGVHGKKDAIKHDVHVSKNILDIVYKLKRIDESKTVKVLERSLFVGLFSEFDVFIGNLMASIYLLKPELFKEIKREISLSELLVFETVDAVKKNMLEKEIDSFRRDSYIDQFSNFEKKFKISLRDFPEWAKFVEIGQRRNLMTHNGGVVSEQYISNCTNEGYKFTTPPKSGEELPLGTDYFVDAIETLSKVAFMLAHTLWRKLLPSDNETEIANTYLNLNVYELLRQKRWKLAVEFGNFGLRKEISKNTSDLRLRMRVVNTAIALKQCGRNNDAVSLLNSIDWSASIRDFKLADVVLKEDYAKAQRIMKDIGKRGELISQISYHEWPLFYDFRETKEFQDTYFEIYKIPFVEKVSEDASSTTDTPKSPDFNNVNELLTSSLDAHKPVKKRTRRSVAKNSDLE